MKRYSVKQAKKKIVNDLHSSNFKMIDTLDDGRIIVFTNLFVHKDKGIWDEVEEDEELEDNEEIVEEVITLNQLKDMSALENELCTENETNHTTQA